MPPSIRRPRSAALLFLLLLAAASPVANGGKILTLDDYGRWSRVVSTAISPDGAWVGYGYRPNGGDDTLFVKRIADGKLYTLANGSEPKFSDDSAWAAYVVSLPKKEADKLRKAKKPVTKAVELLNLASGEKFKVENASSFTFPAGAKVVAIKRDKADREAKHDGVDLIVRTLATGQTQNIGNVADYAFDKSGAHLAFTIDAPDELGNGVGVLDLERGTMTSLDAAAARYAQVAWNESGDRLAALRGTKAKGKMQRENALLLFRTGAPRAARPVELSSAPDGMVISEYGDVLWSKDSSRVFIGLKEQQPESDKPDEPVANVDVWHWKDERVQSIQAVRATADSRATLPRGSRRRLGEADGARRRGDALGHPDRRREVGNRADGQAVSTRGRMGRQPGRLLPDRHRDRRPDTHREEDRADARDVARQPVVPVPAGRRPVGLRHPRGCDRRHFEGVRHELHRYGRRPSRTRSPRTASPGSARMARRSSRITSSTSGAFRSTAARRRT